jgi:hypothetical protein
VYLRYSLADTSWAIAAGGIRYGGRHSSFVLPLLSRDTVTEEPGLNCDSVVRRVARRGLDTEAFEALDFCGVSGRHVSVGKLLAPCLV